MIDAHELEIVQHNATLATVDAKPCCRRLRALSGASSWCYLPSRHAGDCHGIGPNESSAPIEYTKGRRR